MPNQPVDDHSEEFEQLAGLSALRVLEGDELASFEQHAEHCERCRLLVSLDTQALMAVSLVAPEMDPSPDFKQRLMQRAAAELASAGGATPSVAVAEPAPSPPPAPSPRAPTPINAPPNVVPFRRRSTWLSALAAVLVVGLVSIGAYSYENQPVARYDLSGSAPGSASVVVRRSGAVELEMHGVPDPGPGYVYEAWIIPPGQAPVAAGVTTTGTATVPLPRDVHGATVAVTRESGRVDAPTSAPLMAAVVQS